MWTWLLVSLLNIHPKKLRAKRLSVLAKIVRGKSANMIPVAGNVGLISLLVLLAVNPYLVGTTIGVKDANIKCISPKLKRQAFISVLYAIRP